MENVKSIAFKIGYLTGTIAYRCRVSYVGLEYDCSASERADVLVLGNFRNLYGTSRSCKSIS